MKNSLYSFAILLSFSSIAQADWLPQEAASYEIVNSHAEVEVDEKGLYTEQIETQLRPLNEEGRTQLVMKSIPFVPDAESIKVLSASTITDGVETKVDLKTIKERSGKGDDHGVNHLKELVISFPNIKIGSIVKYKTEKKQIRNFVPGYFAYVFTFGHGVPELAGSARIKSKLPLSTSHLDLWQISTMTQKQENGYSIVEIRQTKPVFKFPREYNPIFDFNSVAKIEITSSITWNTYAKAFAEKYESILDVKKLPPQLENIAKKAEKAKSLEEKIDIVTSELSTVMTYAGDWTSYEKMFFPKSISEIASKKIGDCKDFTLATTAILRRLGIQANPAFTVRKAPTSELGIISYDSLGSPVIDSFNHAIVKVKDKERVIWVDPTNIVSDAAYTFADIAGSKAIEISKDAKTLEVIPYPEGTKNKLVWDRTIKFKEDESAESIATFEATGEYPKYVLETSLRKNQEDGKKVLNVFLRTLDKSAKAYYENVDFTSRKSHLIKGTQKVFGERIIGEEKGKTYISVPLPVTLYGMRAFPKPRVTGALLGATFEEKSITRIEGYDFVDFPNECTILTPWFVVVRNVFKTEKGFEVHDEIKSHAVRISSRDINSDKFQMHVGDVFDCIGGQSLEVRKLEPGDTLAKRLKDYTPQKMKELFNTSGPKSVSSYEKMNHIAHQILSKDPKNLDGLLAEARAYRFLGYKHSNVDRTEYQEKYDQILKNLETLYPEDLNVKITRARYWIRGENYAEAAKAFSAFFKPDLKSFEAYYVGGMISKGLKKPQAAAGAYQKALQLTSDKFEQALAYDGLGDAYEELGDQDKAISFYKQSLGLNPENTWLHGELVSMLTKLKRWDEAIDEGEKMLKISDFGVGRRQLAEAYQAKAKDTYEKTQLKDPTFESPESKKALETVESSFLKGLRHVPNNATCLFSLGEFYYREATRRGDAQLARQGLGILEKAEKADDNEYVSKQMLTGYKNDLKDLADGKSARNPANK